MKKAVFALFTQIEDAHQAVQALSDNGFSREQINMMLNDRGGEYTRQIGVDPDADPADLVTPKAAAMGAGTGAVIGAITGLLVGLGTLILPGIGTVIAAGPLATALATLSGAGVGAASGGIVGGVVGLLTDYGVSNETAELYVEGIRRGGVLVIVTGTEAELGKAEEILSRFSPVQVDEQSRVWEQGGWGGRNLDRTPENKNEPGYTPDASQDPRDVKGATRSEEERLDHAFRNFYHNSRNSLKYQYEECLPAYEYGRKLKTDPRFWKLSWDEIEPVVQKDWEEQNPHRNWEDFRDSIRYMWEGNLED